MDSKSICQCLDEQIAKLQAMRNAISDCSAPEVRSRVIHVVSSLWPLVRNELVHTHLEGNETSESVQPDKPVLSPECEPTAQAAYECHLKAGEVALQTSLYAMQMIRGWEDSGLVAFNHQFRYVVWNTAMEKMTGLPEAEVLGRGALDLFPFLVETGDFRAMEAAIQGVSTVQSDRPFTLPGISDQGWFEAHYAPLYDAAQEIIGGWALVRDVTRQRAEERSERQSDHFGAIADIIAGMAHQLRNALQRSQACLDVLSLKIGQHPEQQDLIQRIQNAQDHLHSIYEEVRVYTLPLKIKKQSLDIIQTIQQVWGELLLAQLRNSQIELILQSDTAIGSVQADPVSLKRVFKAVLDNAAYANQCSGKIFVQIENFHGQDGPQIAVNFVDQGPGLDRQQQSRLFEPFYTTKIQSTGLGMTIAKRIIDAHGGMISARSSSGTGTEIQIVLPRN